MIGGLPAWPLGEVSTKTNQAQTSQARITATSLQTQTSKAQIQYPPSVTVFNVNWPGAGPNRLGRFPQQQGNTTVPPVPPPAPSTTVFNVNWPGAGPNRLSRFLAWQGSTTPSTPAAPSVQHQTQTAKARVRVTTTKTQSAKARITVTTTQTQPAKARIQVDASQTQPAKARVTASTAQTQSAKARVRVTTAQTQTARGRIGPSNLSVRAPASPGLTAQYGTFTLDETNGILITSEYDSADTSIFGNYYLEFRCRLTPDKTTGDVATDDATFGAMIRAVESSGSGLRTPRQRLLVKFGDTIVRDWNFTLAAQTAFLIEPELSVIRMNRRDFTYGFRIRCQFQGNVPANAYRRESLTSTGTTIRENRTCTITATWTSSLGVTSLTQYQNNGDNFFNAYLPPVGTDQYGFTGVWVRADEIPVATNDESSITTATRVYWECFSGRRESSAQALTTLGERRVFAAPSVWVSTTGFTALQNYTSGGDAFYGKILPAPISANAAWVLVKELPAYNDQNGVLTVERIYHETVGGLREYGVEVTTLPGQIRRVVIRGTYYTTGLSAYTNFSTGVGPLVRGILAGLTPPMTRYESKAIPKVEGYNTTTKIYSFVWTLNELACPQALAVDDVNITVQTLDLDNSIPLDAQTTTPMNPVTRLSLCQARFTAFVDYTVDRTPQAIWTAYVRSYVLNAIVSQLGANVNAVEVVDEKVSVGLHNSSVSGTLWLVVTGGSLLWMRLVQTITQVPGRRFVGRADGTPLSFYPYRKVAHKKMHREAHGEYVMSSVAPTFFAPGDNLASGFGMVDTQISAQGSIDAQNAAGPLALDQGWFIDPDAPAPYAYSDLPTTRGVGFETVVHHQSEDWLFIEALEPGQ